MTTSAAYLPPPSVCCLYCSYYLIYLYCPLYLYIHQSNVFADFYRLYIYTYLYVYERSTYRCDVFFVFIVIAVKIAVL